MSKGEQTRTSIMDRAVDLASEVGLEGLTIGTLAKRAGMSKSGLYAHFESKEDLQTQVLHATAEAFVDEVVSPALKKPRGVPRIEELFERWLDWSQRLSGGCVFVAAATEFDDRGGPVRSTLVGHLHDVLGVVSRAARIAVEEGHFSADLDDQQFAFEFWSVILGYHHYSRLLRREDARERASRAFASVMAVAKRS